MRYDTTSNTGYNHVRGPQIENTTMKTRLLISIIQNHVSHTFIRRAGIEPSQCCLTNCVKEGTKRTVLVTRQFHTKHLTETELTTN